MKLVEIKNFSARFIKNINLKIDDGEIILLTGTNFSGKSEVLKSMKKKILSDYTGTLDFFVNDNEIAYVPQNYDTQLILSTVMNELVFTMENLKLDNFTMNKRLAECANFFCITDLLSKNINELSGGQKQLISLCSAIITHPKIILLDDVFSQIDATTQYNLLNLIQLMRDDFGITFVIASSSLDNIIKICSRMIFMTEGRIIIDDRIQIAMRRIFSSPFKIFLPLIPLLSLENGMEKVCLTVQEFNECQEKKLSNLINAHIPKIIDREKSAIELKNVSYKYRMSDKFIISNLSWNVPYAINCLMGANGCGKTTLLKLIAGFFKPYCGSVKSFSRNIKYMPQNVLSVFTQLNFAKQIEDCADKNFVTKLLDTFNISFAVDENIYEMSPSCQQILAFISIVVQKPDILLLDEPTKFLDKNNIDIMKNVLKSINSTIIIASHNVEFVSSVSDSCLMIFNGNIAYEHEPEKFFSENSFYTLQINGVFDN